MAEQTTTTAESAYRQQWARLQAADARDLRLAEIARAERALADAQRRLAFAELQLAAAQEVS